MASALIRLTVNFQIDKAFSGANIDYNDLPTCVVHSRKLFETHIWNQETGHDTNRTLKEPGNYTLTVTLGESRDYGELANFYLR